MRAMPPNHSLPASLLITLSLACSAHAGALFGASAHSVRIERQDEAPDASPIGAPSDPEFVRLVAMWENDGIFKGIDRTDRYYSNGIKFDAAWALGSDGGTRRGFGLSVGHAIFTPGEIETARLRVDDRPYAGWLYGAAYWQWDTEISGSVRTLDHLEFDLGVVGPSADADTIQKKIHTAFEQERPRGWHHQLRDELAIDVTYRKKWRITLSEEYGSGLGFDVIPMLEGTLGTVYRRVGAGVTVRGGIHLPDDFGPMRIDDVGSATTAQPLGDGEQSVYGFASIVGRLTEHNIFLDGNQFNDSHSVTKKPYTAEFRVGIEWTNRCGFHASYAWTFQTDTFWGQDGVHSFATIVLGWTHTF